LLRKLLLFSVLSGILFANKVSANESHLVFKVGDKEYLPKLLEEKEVVLKVWELEIPKKGGLVKKIRIYQVNGNSFFTRLYHYDPKKKLLVLDQEKTAQVLLGKKSLEKIKKAEELLASEGFVPKFTKGKKVVYVFLDPICPFCKKEVKEGLLDKLQEKYNVVVIPYAVHKKSSEDIISNMMYYAKGGKTDLVSVFKEAFKDDSKFKALSSINFTGNNSKYHKLIKKVNHLVKEAGIPGTPAFVIENKIYVGKLPAKFLETGHEG